MVIGLVLINLTALMLLLLTLFGQASDPCAYDPDVRKYVWSHPHPETVDYYSVYWSPYPNKWFKADRISTVELCLPLQQIWDAAPPHELIFLDVTASNQAGESHEEHGPRVDGSWPQRERPSTPSTEPE